ATAVGPRLPVLDRLLQRMLRVDCAWWPLVRRVPRQRERNAFASLHRELAERAQVFAAMLDGRPKAEPVRAGDRDAAVLDPPDPRDCAAVVEADDELGEHVDVAAQPFHDPDDVGRLSARGHEVDDAYGPGVRFPLCFEYE